MNPYEKNSGMKVPTTPAVEERIAESINVFFRPDDDEDGEDEDDGDDADDDGKNSRMMMTSPYLSASQPQPKLPTISPTM